MYAGCSVRTSPEVGAFNTFLSAIADAFFSSDAVTQDNSARQRWLDTMFSCPGLIQSSRIRSTDVCALQTDLGTRPRPGDCQLLPGNLAHDLTRPRMGPSMWSRCFCPEG